MRSKKSLDIYLMGIGGTGMGSFAGLLQASGHRVTGSDLLVYSPMREKLSDLGISYRTPYAAENLPKACDLVIVGNAIRRDNPEAEELIRRDLPYKSFPSALRSLFLSSRTAIVASGTHGKTTCSSLLAHCLYSAGIDLGFLIGGVPINFDSGFRVPGDERAPFVIEGDEYDTAFFDKRPKFIHYDPNILLVTSLEFDHGDIYRDLDAVIDAFSAVMAPMGEDRTLVINADEPNIGTAIERSKTRAKMISYGERGHYRASGIRLDSSGMGFLVMLEDCPLGEVELPLFGHHNMKNALGCYAVLHRYGLAHEQIATGFKTFKGVRRRLEERGRRGSLVLVDDFAHHPSAVRETLRAARQRYPGKEICAVFEPRSATSCTRVFERPYEEALSKADRVFIAPVGRSLPEGNRLDTGRIAGRLFERSIKAKAFFDLQEMKAELLRIERDAVLVFMSNGDFRGLLDDIVG